MYIGNICVMIFNHTQDVNCLNMANGVNVSVDNRNWRTSFCHQIRMSVLRDFFLVNKN